MSIKHASRGPIARSLMNYRDLEAEGFGCRQTIWRMVRAGEFPAPRDLGRGRIAFIRSEVEAWLASRPVAQNAPEAA